MKKTLKKLTLNRETLRHLEAAGLRTAAGGGPTAIDCSITCLGAPNEKGALLAGTERTCSDAFC